MGSFRCFCWVRYSASWTRALPVEAIARSMTERLHAAALAVVLAGALVTYAVVQNDPNAEPSTMTAMSAIMQLTITVITMSK